MVVRAVLYVQSKPKARIVVAISHRLHGMTSRTPYCRSVGLNWASYLSDGTNLQGLPDVLNFEMSAYFLGHLTSTHQMSDANTKSRSPFLQASLKGWRLIPCPKDSFW